MTSRKTVPKTNTPFFFIRPIITQILCPLSNRPSNRVVEFIDLVDDDSEPAEDIKFEKTITSEDIEIETTTTSHGNQEDSASKNVVSIIIWNEIFFVLYVL